MVEADTALEPIRDLADTDRDATLLAILVKRQAELTATGQTSHPESLALIAKLT